MRVWLCDAHRKMHYCGESMVKVSGYGTCSVEGCTATAHEYIFIPPREFGKSKAATDKYPKRNTRAQYKGDWRRT